jgi:hypothetical protein
MKIVGSTFATRECPQILYRLEGKKIWLTPFGVAVSHRVAQVLKLHIELGSLGDAVELLERLVPHGYLDLLTDHFLVGH